MRVPTWDERPKTEVFITRHWRTRGIYKREAAEVAGTYFTNEDSGAGINWTPYTLGVDCFMTVREAWNRTQEEYAQDEKTIMAAQLRLGSANVKVHTTYSELLVHKEETK